MNPTLGLVSVSFRKNSPAEILAEMKKADLCCIEWGSDIHAPCTDEGRLRELAALQKEHGIYCCSYGTYFRLGVTPIEELTAYIRAAKLLGTDILRLWCGAQDSEDYTAAQKEALFADCRAAAAIAQEAGVTLCMECHNKTYTNRKEAALELMEAVASPRFRMYWQPNQFRSDEENIAAARLLAPFTTHLHVFNWKEKEKFPLADGIALWREYLAAFKGAHTLLLEFMPKGGLSELCEESAALHSIISGD